MANYSANVAAFTFTFIGEALFMLWLLAKGRNVTPKAWSYPASASPAVHGGGAVPPSAPEARTG